ncbi:MAG: hypothetical protein JXB88_11425 [Spirochaetales bacterium]|nr:hypothetical protein [Spirochaetales bacterium]
MRLKAIIRRKSRTLRPEGHPCRYGFIESYTGRIIRDSFPFTNPGIRSIINKAGIRHMAKDKPALQKQDYDSPWKQLIEELLESFLGFFFPRLHADIDFSRGYEIKSKELYKLLKEQEIGKRYADELIKVYLKDGTEKWLLVHIEVQSYKEEDFAKRMFIYYYRIFDRYNHQVVSLVVLTDPDITYRPDTFLQAGWGFEHKLSFPLVKIIDFKGKKKDLEQSSNPMATVVLAQLKCMESADKTPEVRFDVKLTLVRMLYRKGYNKNQVRQVFNFIDWLISLPLDLEEKIIDEVIKIEEVKKMTYITNAERIGEKRGEKRGEMRGKKLGEKLGEKRGIKKIAIKMLKRGDSVEDVMEVTDLSREEVLAMKKKG